MIATPLASKKRVPRSQPSESTSQSTMALALEPRYMFDAAGVATGAEVAVEAAAQDLAESAVARDRGASAEPSTPISDPSLLEALGATAPRAEIIFIDAGVEDYEQLIDGVSAAVEVIVLDADRDGVAQIAEALGSRDGIDAVHMVSHGNADSLSLGNAVLNLASMSGRHAADLASIGQSLDAGADIRVYGCNFGDGILGKIAVARLAELTSADVAASNDTTGSEAIGADWDLEVQHGSIESATPFAQAAMSGYAHALADAITIDFKETTDSTPPISGGLNDSTTVDVSITVNGANYTTGLGQVQIVGGGTQWRIANDVIAPFLPDATYDVQAEAFNGAGTSVGTDTTTGELIVDTSPPSTPTANSLVTSNTRPTLTGTFDDTDTSLLKVEVGGNLFTRQPGGAGSAELTVVGNAWTLDLGTLAAPLNDGTYDVVVTSSDGVGNTSLDTTANELVIDTVAPVVGVDSQQTSDSTPALTGTVDDANAKVEVSVNGQGPFVATNNGDGTWTLANDTLAALPDAVYDISATATDAGGQVGTDASAGELTIDTVTPAVTVNNSITTDTTPQLTGTVDDPTAAVSITVGGQTLAATNNGDGTWTLADDALAALAEDTYGVSATATDGAGNVGIDPTANELIVDTTAPTVTVNSLTTANATPSLSGTLSDGNATVQITVNGVSYAASIIEPIPGFFFWSLAAGVIDPALPDATYEVQAVATDIAGNVGTDASTNELIVDLPPVVTVNALNSTDSTPELTGTIDDPTAAIVVTVNGVAYPAVNNGDGTWTLANDTINPPLANGTFDIAVTATDTGKASKVGTDPSTDELVIAVAPAGQESTEQEPVGSAQNLLTASDIPGSEGGNTGNGDGVAGNGFGGLGDERIPILGEVRDINGLVDSSRQGQDQIFLPDGAILYTSNSSVSGASAFTGAAPGDDFVVSSVLIDGSLYIDFEFRTENADRVAVAYSATLIEGIVLPTWLRINAETGLILGTPPVDAEPFVIKVTVSLSDGTSLTRDLRVDPATGALSQASQVTTSRAIGAEPFGRQITLAAGAFESGSARLGEALGLATND